MIFFFYDYYHQYWLVWFRLKRFTYFFFVFFCLSVFLLLFVVCVGFYVSITDTGRVFRCYCYLSISYNLRCGCGLRLIYFQWQWTQYPNIVEIFIISIEDFFFRFSTTVWLDMLLLCVYVCGFSVSAVCYPIAL